MSNTIRVVVARVLFVLLAWSFYEVEGARLSTSGDDDNMNDEVNGEIQQCVESIRNKDVVVLFTTTDGPYQTNVSMSSAGCFFHLVREAYFAANDDDAEDTVEVHVDLAAGSNDWSRVSQEVLERMLAFGSSKLEQADFDVTKIEFSTIERPVRNDLVAANASQEDSDFMEQVASSQKLFSLSTAAHYVDFPQLYQLCTAKIATMIWGKTKQEIEDVLARQS